MYGYADYEMLDELEIFEGREASSNCYAGSPEEDNSVESHFQKNLVFHNEV